MLLGRELARGRVLRVLHLLLATRAVLRRHVLEWLGGSAVGGGLSVVELGAVGVIGGGRWCVGAYGDVVGAGQREFWVLGHAVGGGVALTEAADEGDDKEDDHGGENSDELVGVVEVVTPSCLVVATEVVDGLSNEVDEVHEEEGWHHGDEHKEGSLAWC